jgi:hypothetical protein
MRNALMINEQFVDIIAGEVRRFYSYESQDRF